jgi:gas vesicle protein
MTETEHPRNDGLRLFLAFVGGALVGGTAAVLLAPRSGAETRRRLTAAAAGAREVASRMPQAIREASSAAQVAFAAALEESAGRDAAPSTHAGPRRRNHS